MKDLHLQTDPENRWSLDIHVSNGVATELPYNVEDRDQREALMAYFLKGTVPHHRDVGISWADYDLGSVTLIDIDNEIKKAMDAYVATEGTTMHAIPMYQRTEDGKIAISMYKPTEVTQ